MYLWLQWLPTYCPTAQLLNCPNLQELPRSLTFVHCTSCTMSLASVFALMGAWA